MTLTAVRPPARFGSIKIKNNFVYYFRKNPLLTKDGSTVVFVFEPEIFNYLKNDKTYLERDPFEKLARKKILKHINIRILQCMDTKRDKDLLDQIIKNKKYKI